MVKQIKKRLLSLVLALTAIVTMIPAVPTYAQGNCPNGAYARAETNITVYNSSGNTQIGTIYNGEGFTILDFSGGDFLEVEYSAPTGNNGAKRGYIFWSRSRLAYYPATCVTTVRNTSNLYYGTNTSVYPAVGTVYAGETVAIVAASGSWGYVEYNTASGRKRGYMPMSNLNTHNHHIDPLYTSANSGSVQHISGNYNVRFGPTTQYPVSGSVSNENVTVYYQTQIGSTTAWYIEYSVTGTGQKKSGFVIFQ